MLLEYLGFKPSMEGFARRLLRALPSSEGGQWAFVREREALTHGANGEISLRNMFVEYSSSKVFARAGLIRKYADLANTLSSEIPALWAAAARNVFPVIRSMFVDATVKIQTRTNAVPQSAAASVPLAGDLQVRLVYDFGNYLTYVSEEQLATWGQTVDDVLERAIANLARLERPGWVDSKRGFSQLASPMSFAESMLLLGNIVDELPFGPFAVLLPCNRGVLLAADGRSEDALQAMLREATRCAEQEPWPMTATLCTRTDGKWHEFSTSGETAVLAHGLFIAHLADDYAAQKEALDALHERLEIDVFTASCSVLTRDDAKASYCVWSEGVVSLLPVTDWVALVPEDPEAGFKHVRWQDMLDVCGERLRPTDESPARFLVDTFPDSAQWEAMEAGNISI